MELKRDLPGTENSYSKGSRMGPAEERFEVLDSTFLSKTVYQVL